MLRGMGRLDDVVRFMLRGGRLLQMLDSSCRCIVHTRAPCAAAHSVAGTHTKSWRSSGVLRREYHERKLKIQALSLRR